MFKNIIRLFFHSLFLLLMFFCLKEYKLVIYGISQARGQCAIIRNAEPVEKVLGDASFPESLKEKLLLINKIKKYAVDSLGIKPSTNYETIYNQHDKPILKVVTACEPYSFKPFEWDFPVLGTVPYKGFFNFRDAEKEVALLKGKGYDVDVYSPSAWSTLGWFKDPIQSNMLKQSDGSLANTIIHELTHGTLFVKNNVTFNENLASFIGDKGAENFLQTKYGIASKQYEDYEAKKEDGKIFNEYILKGVEKLTHLYDSLSKINSVETKQKLKLDLISKIVKGVNTLPLKDKKGYFNYSLNAFYEGNTFFMAFKRYDSQYDLFEKEYKEKFHSNLRDYLNYLKSKYPSL